MVDSLRLSYHTTKELNCIIDEEMPGRPKFKCEQVHISGESYDFHFQEIIPCLCVLLGDPRFLKDLTFSPEHNYQDVDHTVQVFSAGTSTIMTYLLSWVLTLPSAIP